VGKRGLESAIQQAADVDVQVQWLPFQLNSQASKTGVNKVEMYMQKFGKTKQEVMQMSQFMKGNFDKAGLPYKFTDQSLTGNTFNSHRLIAYAYSMGADVQDKVVEHLFNAYFAEERFLNDPEVLVEAALVAGIPEDVARAFVSDESQFKAETDAEMQVGRQMGVNGVPHFVLQNADGKKVSLSGAQPPEAFVEAFNGLKEQSGRLC